MAMKHQRVFIDHRSRRVRGHWVRLGLVCAVSAAGGCRFAGWAADAALGDADESVEAVYKGLAGKRVAVLVAAPQATLYRHPQAPLKIGRCVSGHLAENVDGITLSDPAQLNTFHLRNPHWPAIPPSRLMQRLGVERMVVIDLAEYATHEPGNAHVLQGIVVGRVGVSAAEADHPDVQVFSQVVSARYPAGSPIGVVGGDEQTIELGMLDMFARRTAGLFHDHRRARPR